MRWTEERAIWVPVKSKPPWELPSPAGAIFLTPANPPHLQLQKPNFMFPNQLCIWYLSVEEGHVITLSFRNFSLETQDVCEFDYVEVHDSADTGAGRVLGR